jgi:hypothetical protein
MFTVERHVGRLVETRPISPLAEGEMERADAAMDRCVEAAGGQVILCADYRRLTVLSVEQAARFVALFKRSNRYVLFSAILVAAHSAVSVLQMERVIREAANPARRCFRSPQEAREWLEPHLTAEEQARLARFIGETPDAQEH